MKNLFKSGLFRYLLSVISITGTVCFILSPVSCRLTEEGIEILPGDKACPVIESFDVTGSSSVYISCSEKILLSDVELYENIEGVMEKMDVEIESVDYDETGKAVEVKMQCKTEIGHSYSICGVLSDTSGNSCLFEQTFIGYNENPAVLMINEIRTKCDSSNKKPDFVEFYVLKGGNTYGYELYAATHGNTDPESDSSRYVFESMEVNTGEYIVLHNKTYDEENSVNETDDDLTLSVSIDSCSTARDLWRSGTASVISVNDVVILKNQSNKKIYDGILMNQNTSGDWNKALHRQYAAELTESGVWTGGETIEDAVNSKNLGSSIYRSVSRKNTMDIVKKFENGEIETAVSSKNDWAITTKIGSGANIVSGATPGTENSTVYYE